eukprot:TRINITY_DN2770_c0_g1_i1.p1 TRINITY_DN2770_c0_g1~~TRINITY_DN2770_c0_g1_i1.p1  ORF type:complete len:149 (+),score=19.43 TRINITY_DN2770_c0_g1_i1:413-859(+)
MRSPYKIKARYIPSLRSLKLSDTDSIDSEKTLEQCSTASTTDENPENSHVTEPTDSLLPATNKVVKLGIQLYSVSKQHHSSLGGGRKRYRYVVDIQKLVGEMFPFMDLCAKLVQNLQSKRKEEVYGMVLLEVGSFVTKGNFSINCVSY